MLAAIIRVLLKIKTRDRIPKLPRGMLATEYEKISRDDGRVLARLGARSPSGVKLALRRAGADTVNDLIRGLAHYRPQRHIARRFGKMIGRLLNASDTPPHRAELLEEARRARNQRSNAEVEARLKLRIEEIQRLS